MCGFHFITSLPHSMFCICPAILISSHVVEKQSMYRLKSLKERIFPVGGGGGENLSLCRECFRQKGLEDSVRYIKVNINFMYCAINTTIR